MGLAGSQSGREWAAAVRSEQRVIQIVAVVLQLSDLPVLCSEFVCIVAY